MPNIMQVGKSANFTVEIPAGYGIRDCWVLGNNGNAVTGGLRIGTTDGGADVVTAQTVGANAKAAVLDSDLSKRFFSKTANQTLYVQAVTSWNSANIDLYMKLERLAA